MEKKKPSIMDALQAAVDDVTMSLADSFSLEDYRSEEDGSSIFVDGALDGIYLFHGEEPRHNAEALNGCLTFIRRLADCKEGEGACDLVDRYAAKHRAVEMMDVFQKMLFTYKSQFNADNIVMSALMTMMDTRNIESVKYALMIFEVYQVGNLMEEVKPNIYLAGLCEEFTFYALNNMDDWNDGADWIAETAVHVHGWGRIHVVRHMKGVTQAQCDWLLSQGWRNDVDPGYSVVECVARSHIQDKLKSDEGISEEEFLALQEMMPALIQDSPIGGIKAYPEWVEFIKRYLMAAQTYRPQANTRLIARILGYMARNAGGDSGEKIEEAIAAAYGTGTCSPEDCASCTEECESAGVDWE